jgi:hypothetical protein
MVQSYGLNNALEFVKLDNRIYLEAIVMQRLQSHHSLHDWLVFKMEYLQTFLLWSDALEQFEVINEDNNEI